MFLFSSWSAAPISLPSPHLSISPGCTADPPCRWLGTPAPGSLAVPVPCSAVISNSLAVHALYAVPVHNLYTTGIQPVPHSSPLFPSVTPSLTCTPLPIHYAGVRRTRAHLECHIGVPCSAETSNSMAVPTLFDIWGFVAVPISPLTHLSYPSLLCPSLPPVDSQCSHVGAARCRHRHGIGRADAVRGRVGRDRRTAVEEGGGDAADAQEAAACAGAKEEPEEMIQAAP